MNIGVLNGFEGLVAQYNVDNSKVIRFKKKNVPKSQIFCERFESGPSSTDHH